MRLKDLSPGEMSDDQKGIYAESVAGKRGTVVRLKVIPKGKTEPVVYAITRDKIELHERYTERHLLEQLIHRDLVVVGILGVRNDADVETGKGLQQAFTRQEAGEGNVLIKAALFCSCFERFELRP